MHRASDPRDAGLRLGKGLGLGKSRRLLGGAFGGAGKRGGREAGRSRRLEEHRGEGEQGARGERRAGRAWCRQDVRPLDAGARDGGLYVAHLVRVRVGVRVRVKGER